MKGGESRLDNGWPNGLRPRPEARPRGTEKPQVERRGACVLNRLKDAHAAQGVDCYGRHAALHPLGFCC